LQGQVRFALPDRRVYAHCITVCQERLLSLMLGMHRTANKVVALRAWFAPVIERLARVLGAHLHCHVLLTAVQPARVEEAAIARPYDATKVCERAVLLWILSSGL
jgi:hypothetical protein